MHKQFIPALAAAFAVAACGGGDTATSDTSATQAQQTDSSAGVAAAATRAPAKDADHEFMRMMVDHHEGLIEMASAAMTRAAQPATQGDAHNMHTKQEEEQKRMMAMIQSQYGDSITPMVLPSNRAMIDSLAPKTGAAYDTTFYRNVIAHHREAVGMVDQFLPRFTKPEVRQMAEKMKTDQQREITEMQRKVGG